MAQFDSPKVAEKFDAYPGQIREQLLYLRQLILETASEMNEVGEVEETLKWGEPSYITKPGSTIRIGWKESNPQQYVMYFNCRTSLTDTFRAIYGDLFNFEGNRAIVFDQKETIPVDELKHCISLALIYHRVKHLPMLGT